MPVDDVGNQIREIGNDSKTNFEYAFKIFSSTDLVVDKKPVVGDAVLQVLGVDYTVNIETVGSGGSIDYIVAPLSGVTSIITRDVPYNQLNSIPSTGLLPGPTIEANDDKAAILTQQLLSLTDASVKYSPTADETEGPTLPDPSDGLALKWSGTDLVNTTVDPDTQTDAAAASAVDAADSATDAQTAETNAETAESNAETAESNASGFANDSSDSADEAAASVASVNFPPIATSDVGDLLKVNAGKTGYEFISGVSSIQTGTTSIAISSDIITETSNSVVSRIMDALGVQTLPLQPSFLAVNAGAQSDMTTEDTIVFGTEVADQGDDFSNNIFTAPVDGLYQLNVNIRIETLDNSFNYTGFSLVTSNRTYIVAVDATKFTGDCATYPFHIVVLCDMDANDTAFVKFVTSGSTNTDIADAGDAVFSGSLIN